jgi:hypothetical protein
VFALSRQRLVDVHGCFGAQLIEFLEEMSLHEGFHPLVNKRNYGKSQFLMGKSTINGHFQ